MLLKIFLGKVLVIPEKVVPLHPQFKIARLIGVWCNGNTADSGPAFPGSSPGTPTEKKRGFHGGSLFLFAQNLKIILIYFEFRPIYTTFASQYILYN